MIVGTSASLRALCRLYALVLVGVTTLLSFLFLLWGFAGRDHFGQIPLLGNDDYYVNYDDGISRELQDRDIFYHGIGASIARAREVDIVILGHSSAIWAFRDDLLHDFAQQYGIQIYNLALAGDPSGEFARLILKRGNIKPALLIINADDRRINFFEPIVSSAPMFGDSNASVVIKSTWIGAYMRVARRNIRWNLSDLALRLAPWVLDQLFRNRGKLRTWRRISTGGWNFSRIPLYWSTSNPPVVVTRSQDCHSTSDEIANARSYIDSVGSPSLLTLIPVPEYCPQRVKELAAALGLESIFPPRTDYTAVDKVHYDYRGATSFTLDFIHELVATQSFQQLIARKKQ